MFCSSVLICKTFFSGRWWLVPSASTRWGIYVDIFICGRMLMMRKVSNNGVNAINSLKSKILIFFSLRRRTPVSFLNNQRFSARYSPVNRCFGLLWILNYFSGSGCCLGVLHHQEPGIQGGDKLFWDYKKSKLLFVFVPGGVGESWDADNLDDEWTRYHSQSQNQGEHQWGNTESK